MTKGIYALLVAAVVFFSACLAFASVEAQAYPYFRNADGGLVEWRADGGSP